MDINIPEDSNLEIENEMLKEHVKTLVKEVETQKNKVEVVEYIKLKDYPPEVLGLFDCSDKDKIEQVKEILEIIFKIPERGKVSSSVGFNYFVNKINEEENRGIKIITEYDEVMILDKIFSYLNRHEEIMIEIFGNDYKNNDGSLIKKAFFDPTHTKTGENIERVSFLKF